MSVISPTAQAVSSVMIVDDHPALCEGLGHRVDSQPDMAVCGQAADVDEAVAKIDEIQPMVVIVDIALRNSDGVELLKEIKHRFPHVRTLVHSMYEESLYADRCLRAGAKGYVNKESNPQEVIKAIREIVQGRIYLSPTMANSIVSATQHGEAKPQPNSMESLTDRQLEVFRLIGEGMSTAQIAERLHISIHTVETHRENLKHKLDCDCARELARKAILWVSQQH